MEDVVVMRLGRVGSFFIVVACTIFFLIGSSSVFAGVNTFSCKSFGTETQAEDCLVNECDPSCFPDDTLDTFCDVQMEEFGVTCQGYKNPYSGNIPCDCGAGGGGMCVDEGFTGWACGSDADCCTASAYFCGSGGQCGPQIVQSFVTSPPDGITVLDDFSVDLEFQATGGLTECEWQVTDFEGASTGWLSNVGACNTPTQSATKTVTAGWSFEMCNDGGDCTVCTQAKGQFGSWTTPDCRDYYVCGQGADNLCRGDSDCETWEFCDMTGVCGTQICQLDPGACNNGGDCSAPDSMCCSNSCTNPSTSPRCSNNGDCTGAEVCNNPGTCTSICSLPGGACNDDGDCSAPNSICCGSVCTNPDSGSMCTSTASASCSAYTTPSCSSPGTCGSSCTDLCGDGIIQGATEQCDPLGPQLGGKTCTDPLLNLCLPGVPGCSLTCTLTANSCASPDCNINADCTNPLYPSCQNPGTCSSVCVAVLDCPLLGGDVGDSCDSPLYGEIQPGCTCACDTGDSQETWKAQSNGDLWSSGSPIANPPREINPVAPLDICCSTSNECVYDAATCAPVQDTVGGVTWACQYDIPAANPTLFKCDGSSRDGINLGGDEDLCCSKGAISGNYEFNTAANLEGPGNSCTDNSDNDCDGELDYDGTINGGPIAPHTVANKGDASCPVGITSGSIPVIPAITNQVQCTALTFPISCDISYTGVRSIIANVTDSAGTSVACVSTGWAGSFATFDCPVPSIDGVATAACVVNEYSYPIVGQDYDTESFTVDCNADVTVHVTDSLGDLDGVLVDISIDPATGGGQTSGTTNVGGDITLQLPFGFHSFVASKQGWFDSRLTNYEISTDPQIVEMFMSPETCIGDCTFGQTNRCQYNCLDQGACDWPGGFDPLDAPTTRFLCEGRLNGTIVDFNETHTVNCCRGPISTISLLESSLEIESCSPQMIPHTTLVTYNGKIHRLTVMTYEPCE